MNSLELGSMFLLGLLSTGHCLGMCGPLVLAIPAPRGNVATHLGYHAGRIFTYVLIGGIVGGLGGALSSIGSAATETLSDIRRVETFLMLISALFLLLFGFVRLGALREPGWMSQATPSHIPGFSRLVGRVAKNSNPLIMIFFGMMMGLLPCGILYAAFAQALATRTVAGGALTVLSFGIGTLPGLLLLGGTASRISLKFRKISDIASSILLLVMAAWIGFKALRFLT